MKMQLKCTKAVKFASAKKIKDGRTVALGGDQSQRNDVAVLP
jgi:hypothetical protein